MRVLVTGAAGFIGSAVVRLLIDTGHEVVSVDKLTYAGSLDSLSAVSRAPRHRFERVDICDALEIRRILEDFAPSAILHLAAETHVDRSIDDPSVFVRTNVEGTYVLLNESLRYWRQGSASGKDPGFRFVHVSTDEVYGSLGVVGGTFAEDSPYNPSSPYAASKASADHLARAWHRTYGLPVIVTNCSNNYGPYQFPEKLIPLTILNALDGQRIPVYGRGENVRSWLHVDDHADALLAVLARGTPGETYLIGADDGERRNIDVVNAICSIIEEVVPGPAGSRRRLIEFVEDRPGHDLRYAIDASKVRNEIGWRPTRSFDAGVRETVAWYMANREWCHRMEARQHGGGRKRIGLGA